MSGSSGQLLRDSQGNRAYGLCVMYGGVPLKDADAVAEGFCELCMPILRAQDLTALF